MLKYFTKTISEKKYISIFPPPFSVLITNETCTIRFLLFFSFIIVVAMTNINFSPFNDRIVEIIWEYLKDTRISTYHGNWNKWTKYGCKDDLLPGKLEFWCHTIGVVENIFFAIGIDYCQQVHCHLNDSDNRFVYL